ncbi:hypothetical protein CBR_g3684 [Chara braunii]|uniref:Uncharacterized protein n=1 Tax=Chara braunii TaxID=69332 RepID=A0A388KG08_CHABU|nr:hypothetical protein CBR_g3684 [Chara braunii]|eukprot:GBG68985.1 hypothetical protein CBR_g3684 [Chara braunii]
MANFWVGKLDPKLDERLGHRRDKLKLRGNGKYVLPEATFPSLERWWADKQREKAEQREAAIRGIARDPSGFQNVDDFFDVWGKILDEEEKEKGPRVREKVNVMDGKTRRQRYMERRPNRRFPPLLSETYPGLSICPAQQECSRPEAPGNELRDCTEGENSHLEDSRASAEFARRGSSSKGASNPREEAASSAAGSLGEPCPEVAVASQCEKTAGETGEAGMRKSFEERTGKNGLPGALEQSRESGDHATRVGEMDSELGDGLEIEGPDANQAAMRGPHSSLMKKLKEHLCGGTDASEAGHHSEEECGVNEPPPPALGDDQNKGKRGQISEDLPCCQLSEPRQASRSACKSTSISSTRGPKVCGSDSCSTAGRSLRTQEKQCNNESHSREAGTSHGEKSEKGKAWEDGEERGTDRRLVHGLRGTTSAAASETMSRKIPGGQSCGPGKASGECCADRGVSGPLAMKSLPEGTPQGSGLVRGDGGIADENGDCLPSSSSTCRSSIQLPRMYDSEYWSSTGCVRQKHRRLPQEQPCGSSGADQNFKAREDRGRSGLRRKGDSAQLSQQGIGQEARAAIRQMDEEIAQRRDRLHQAQQVADMIAASRNHLDNTSAQMFQQLRDSMDAMKKPEPTRKGWSRSGKSRVSMVMEKLGAMAPAGSAEGLGVAEKLAVARGQDLTDVSGTQHGMEDILAVHSKDVEMEEEGEEELKTYGSTVVSKMNSHTGQSFPESVEMTSVRHPDDVRVLSDSSGIATEEVDCQVSGSEGVSCSEDGTVTCRPHEVERLLKKPAGRHRKSRFSLAREKLASATSISLQQSTIIEGDVSESQPMGMDDSTDKCLSHNQKGEEDGTEKLAGLFERSRGQPTKSRFSLVLEKLALSSSSADLQQSTVVQGEAGSEGHGTKGLAGRFESSCGQRIKSRFSLVREKLTLSSSSADLQQSTVEGEADSEEHGMAATNKNEDMSKEGLKAVGVQKVMEDEVAGRSEITWAQELPCISQCNEDQVHKEACNHVEEMSRRGRRVSGACRYIESPEHDTSNLSKAAGTEISVGSELAEVFDWLNADGEKGKREKENVVLGEEENNDEGVEEEEEEQEEEEEEDQKEEEQEEEAEQQEDHEEEGEISVRRGLAEVFDWLDADGEKGDKREKENVVPGEEENNDEGVEEEEEEAEEQEEEQEEEEQEEGEEGEGKGEEEDVEEMGKVEKVEKIEEEQEREEKDERENRWEEEPEEGEESEQEREEEYERENRWKDAAEEEVESEGEGEGEEVEREELREKMIVEPRRLDFRTALDSETGESQEEGCTVSHAEEGSMSSMSPTPKRAKSSKGTKSKLLANKVRIFI